ncbi:Rieske (2Fe-2S) protein [Paracoccus aminophilus]|uniref:Rieske (2Fe-2S) domain protein n=1 Tax=Paracoccus aminophilus JCM 7686 TaxID=1367847 RepID=S5XS58_PARAH|nr:Rieske (2Fe-2S) protein [Paracoccus aminophilus]AGT10289.1 Rieske (2Fe-2S) domain protein [Paracoccus aminophilus JCM 7686]
MPSSVWTPIALASDLPPRLVIPVSCDGQDLALWRAESGKVQAWNDRCPHRGMRLSHGFVRGEFLSCIYHGWRYDGAGICRKIPAHPDLEPPATIRVNAWSCVEQDGVIWVAPQGAEGEPPAFAGLAPLRSLAVEAAPEEIALACDSANACVLTKGDLTILMQHVGTTAVLHALIAAEADAEARIAASRRLEALRFELEAATKEKVA